MSQSSATSSVISVGQTVRVHQKIKEGTKERIQIFEGLIIDIKNKSGIDHIFMVRKMVDGVGVEKIFALNSPFIDKVEIIKSSDVRRANLSYMKNRRGKMARMKNEKVMNNSVVSKTLKTIEQEDAKNIEAVTLHDETVQQEENVVIENPIVENTSEEVITNSGVEESSINSVDQVVDQVQAAEIIDEQQAPAAEETSEKESPVEEK